MTAEFLGINIPFMVLFFSLWVGIPMWMIFRHPDRHPRETRTVPAYLRQQTATALPAQRQAADRAERRELVGASSSLRGAQTSKDRSGAAISPHAGTVFFAALARYLGPGIHGTCGHRPGHHDGTR